MTSLGLASKKVGTTSFTVTCLLRNKATKKTICLADDIVFVVVDPETKRPVEHGKTAEMLFRQTESE